ncbi:MAG: DUF2189 domain-containing protein [Gammaproteobacteria bacterium]|nr:MAG: DUF2189 domain-containing protein [Gammaproteobacteria bacterium]
MSEMHAARETGDRPVEPLFLPARPLDMAAPFRWLRKGWSDMMRAPLPSMAYGIAVVLFFYLLAWLVWDGGNTVALFSLVVAFILAGPLLAFGLYSISRQLERGQKPRLGVCLRESRHQLRNELLFAIVLLVVLLIWARAATMVNIFAPINEEDGLLGIVQYLLIGSAVGSIFAAIVFSISVVSLPMMLDRETDAITAALTSINAVLKNKGPMLLWALIIITLMVIGLATFLLGLALVLPLLGHATWHAYRETVWPPGAAEAPVE